MAFTKADIEFAQAVQSKYGVPASVTLAAYQLESGGGTSYLARNNNNYFGITGTGTAGYSQGSHKWAKYNNKEESFDAFGKLLSSEKYAKLTAGKTNVEDYVRAYAETYAPSSDGNSGYADKMIDIINSYNLKQYDSGITGSMAEVEQTGSNAHPILSKFALVITLLLILLFGSFAIYKTFQVGS